MLKQLVDVVSALLLVSLCLGALFPGIRLATGRDPARPGPRPVLWGAGFGVLGGGIMILVHQTSMIRFDRQRLTLTTLEPTVILGLVVVVVTWLFAPKTLRRIASADSVEFAKAENPVPILWRRMVTGAGALWAFLIFFRHTQTVYVQTRSFVPATATVFSTATFLNVLGFVCGLAIVTLAGVVTWKLCQRRRAITPWLLTALVLLLTAGHVFLIIRLLYAMRTIWLSKEVAVAMSWLVTHEIGLTFLGLGACLVAGVVVWWSGRRLVTADRNPARARLKKAQARSMTRRGALMTGAVVLGFLALTIGKKYSSDEVELSEPEPFDVDDANVSVGLDAISDGHLHRFEYQTSSGTKVRFIAIQKAGSSFGVGLDACEICGATGYYEKDGKVICKLCEVAMNIATIGFKGGCNPIPIEYTVADGKLSVPIRVLEESASVFA